MIEIKRPKWDKCDERRGITQKYKNKNKIDFSEIYGQVNIGESVSSYYKKNRIDMKIQSKKYEIPKEPFKTVFIAIITGFNPPAKQYEDLILGDIVEIARKYICFIRR